jgi:hypothetical protein
MLLLGQSRAERAEPRSSHSVGCKRAGEAAWQQSARAGEGGRRPKSLRRESALSCSGDIYIRLEFPFVPNEEE